ncbi:MAG: hypothetical protein AAF368_17930, partial [Planctomycetota bacterium]
VRRQWNRIIELFDEHLLPLGFDLNGHASDGDARRFEEQLADMTSKDGERYGLFAPDWKGCTLSARVVEKGGRRVVYGIHSQDWIHNGKKLLRPLDNASRVLDLGGHTATHHHVRRVRVYFPASEHNLTEKAVDKIDPQDFTLLQVIVSRKVIDCLERLQEETGEDTLGTRCFLELVREYVLIFCSKKLTLLERIESSGFILDFLRLWRGWLAASKEDWNQKCIPKPAYEHIAMSCHEVILRVMHNMEFCPQLPKHLDESGSDICEISFFEIGGYGRIQTARRSFRFNDALETAGDLDLLALYRCDSKVSLEFKRTHEKSEIIITKEETGDDADLAVYPNDRDEIIEALERGRSRARDLAAKLDMKPTPGADGKLP